MYRRLLVLWIPIVLLISGCKPEVPAFVPLTGGVKLTAPDQVEQARIQVLEYVLASARLESLPRDADWKLETRAEAENEYDFCSGDWRILIWLADSDGGNQRVIILNKVENVHWLGYVTAEGRVVDTAYVR